MKVVFFRRGCTCGKEPCSCESQWAFRVDLGTDSVAGKRKQEQISGFKNLEEAKKAAVSLFHTKDNEDLNMAALAFQLLSTTGMRQSELLSLEYGRKDV